MPRQLRALLLILIFLGGGTSLPGLDVLLFHRTGELSRAVEHVEPDSDCAGHPGHCAIGCPAEASEALATEARIAPGRAVMRSVALRPSRGILTARLRGIGFHSRAPPTLYS